RRSWPASKMTRQQVQPEQECRGNSKIFVGRDKTEKGWLRPKVPREVPSIFQQGPVKKQRDKAETKGQPNCQIEPLCGKQGTSYLSQAQWRNYQNEKPMR